MQFRSILVVACPVRSLRCTKDKEHYVDDVALVFKNALASGGKLEVPPSVVTSGDIRVQMAFVWADADKNFVIIMKDGMIYKNTTQ